MVKTYLAIYKPFGMLSQFKREGERKSLQDIKWPFILSKDIYPVGRLDAESEGLLILTNDNNLKNNVLSPQGNVKKKYLAQLEGEINEDALDQLREGVKIKLPNKEIYKTQPAIVNVLYARDIKLPERIPSIRFRKSIPTSWVSIELTEGKNRQIRKMTAKVGFPTLRLVRVAIGNYSLEDYMVPGIVRNIKNPKEIITY